MLADDLQSYAKCDGCQQILWVEPSLDEQRCGCACGGLDLHNDIINGTADLSFTASDMQAILDAE